MKDLEENSEFCFPYSSMFSKAKPMASGEQSSKHDLLKFLNDTNAELGFPNQITRNLKI